MNGELADDRSQAMQKITALKQCRILPQSGNTEDDRSQAMQKKE